MFVKTIVQKFKDSPLLFRMLILSIMTMICLPAVYVLFIYSSMAVGFRDGCVVAGSPSCALPVIAVEMLLAPLSGMLLLVSIVGIFTKKSWAYGTWMGTVLFIFLQIGLFAAAAYIEQEQNNRYNEALYENSFK